jgi:hypothetical protein
MRWDSNIWRPIKSSVPSAKSAFPTYFATPVWRFADLSGWPVARGAKGGHAPAKSECPSLREGREGNKRREGSGALFQCVVPPASLGLAMALLPYYTRFQTRIVKVSQFISYRYYVASNNPSIWRNTSPLYITIKARQVHRRLISKYHSYNKLDNWHRRPSTPCQVLRFRLA